MRDKSHNAFNFVVNAQLIKTGENTPIKLQKALRIKDSGSVMLSGKGATQANVDVLNSGLLSPSIATEDTCTLVTPRDHGANNYNFAVAFTAGELKPNDETTLATNIKDRVIPFAKRAVASADIALIDCSRPLGDMSINNLVRDLQQHYPEMALVLMGEDIIHREAADQLGPQVQAYFCKSLAEDKFMAGLCALRKPPRA